jgi:cytochrome c peroxidase
MRLIIVVVGLLFACRSNPELKPSADTAAAVRIEAPRAPEAPVLTLSPSPVLPTLPKGLPAQPSAPDTNPLTADKVELGTLLFFDPRLSADGTMACVNCHHIDKAYTSGNALDAKVGGALNKRNSPSMLNLSFASSYYWDGRAPTLEAVSLAAWKGQLGADVVKSSESLNKIPAYRARFERAFQKPADADTVSAALASFFRALSNGDSAFDRFIAGDIAAISKQAQEGWLAFNKAQCTSCHAPPLFSDYQFHAIGINDDAGRKDATKLEEDTGKFKTPSLRNVALTAPYFHDGKTESLLAAVTRMAKGPDAKAKASPQWKAQKLSDKELKAIVAMLETLNGTSTVTAPPLLP